MKKHKKKKTASGRKQSRVEKTPKLSLLLAGKIIFPQENPD